MRKSSLILTVLLLTACATEPSPTSPSVNLPTLPKITRAPELRGLSTWHNSEPLTLESLRGKVVLIDFWTYSCINCIRTFPPLRDLWAKYKDKPFVLIGIHSPEFAFEKLDSNVADAIKRNKLTWPIAQDNDFATWRAFANRYWPAKYLIDAEGYIRYTHFGEGAYEETDMAVMSLLDEIGEADSIQHSADSEEGDGRRYRQQSPETYLGERSWPALANGPRTPSSKPHTYEAPPSLSLHSYALVGEWEMRERERQTLLSDEGAIRMKFLGSEINLVLGLEEGVEPIEADVEIDGEHVQSFTVDVDDLYNLYTGEYDEHELILRLHGAGIAGYAFTFGSK